MLLGFGLVAAFCLIVVGADAFLHLAHEDHGAIAAIAGATAVLDLILLAVLDGTTKRLLLLSFPVLLVISEVALSALRSGGGAVEYSGFLTLVFVYIGLTQARGVGPCSSWWSDRPGSSCRRPWTAELGVRLFLTLGIWLLISEVLAARTERARVKTKRLIVQANTDVLTGLGSRLHLSDRIERANGPSGSALLFIDLDGFKVINETYGHAAGDELLVAVGKRLQAALGQGDLAARLGGDEFVALLEGSTMGDATALAHTLLSSLSEPYALSRGRVADHGEHRHRRGRPAGRPQSPSCATPIGRCRRPRRPVGTGFQSTRGRCTTAW